MVHSTKITLSFLLLFLTSFGRAQNTNNNGELDRIEEFSTKVTVPFTMPDGIDLMTDIYLPITQDSQIISLNLDNLDAPAFLPLKESVNIDLIPKGTQLFIYDSVRVKGGSKVANPNPTSLPMVFTRTPYDKEGDEVGRAVSILGYAYALQDMRGRYTSEGVYLPMYSDSWNKNPYHPNYAHILDVRDSKEPANSNKHEDGYNSVQFIVDSLTRNRLTTVENAWLKSSQVRNINDPICNGSIGMFGASALGNTQYQAASAHRVKPGEPGLKCLTPIVATNEHYQYTGFQNGVFRERIVTGWVKGQIFDGTNDDLRPQDDSIQNDLHTSFDYGLNNKFTAARFAINHFVSVQYGNDPAGYYPNSPGRKEMDASRAPVNKDGEAVGCLDANGDTVYAALHPDQCATGEQFRLPNLDQSRYTNIQVPAYHLTGWWDIFTDGQLETWRLMRKFNTNRIRQNQKIVIGPWAHQTIGGRETGDLTYPENIQDILGFNVGDFDVDNIDLADFTSSEILSWFRMHLNYNNEYKEVGAPTVRIPEDADSVRLSPEDQPPIYARVPAEPYKIEYADFLSYINGSEGLKDMKVEITGVLDTTLTIDIPPAGDPILGDVSGGNTINSIEKKDFTNDVPNVRFYVVGPQDDGTSYNDGKGNYWFAADTFPISNGVQWQDFYLHQDGAMNRTAPQEDEGYKIYVHDPANPVKTMGGGNMIVKTPDGARDAQGQMNLANPKYIEETMDHPGVVSFEYEVTTDSLSIIGYPEVTLYAKSNPSGVIDGPTDTDFFVRVVDVYPDGREFFVVEGAVNARAREYARNLLENPAQDHGMPSANDSTAFTNIKAGKIYEYNFRMMPIGYTFGKGHKIKVLVSSSNHTRYQVNPNLPIEQGEFFKRKPGDGQTYNYKGTEMSPRVAVQRVAFSPEYPTHIKMPVYSTKYVGQEDGPVAEEIDIEIYPNPASSDLHIRTQERGEYEVIIRNIKGQIIHRAGMGGKHRSIDVRDFEKGAYLIEIRGKDQKVRASEKVMVM